MGSKAVLNGTISGESGSKCLAAPISTEVSIPENSATPPQWKDEDIYVLSADWHVRPNYGKGLAYRFSPEEGAMLMLSLEEAVAVAFMNGSTPLGDIVDGLQEALNLNEEAARNAIDRLLEKNRDDGTLLITPEEANGEYTQINAHRFFNALASHLPKRLEALRLEAPLSLTILPTYDCQAECVYCYAERPKGEQSTRMTPQRWEEIFSEAGNLGIDMITFSGGDPLVYPHIERLLSVARDYKMAYILPTKSLVTEKRAQRLAELIPPYGEIQVSVDSFDLETNLAMVGHANYAQRVRTSIGNLRKVGLKVRTNTVVTPLNLHTVEGLIRELNSLGVERSHITNYWRSHYRHHDDLFLNGEQMDQLKETVDRLRRDLQWKKLVCNAGPRDFSIPGSNNTEAWNDRSSCSGGFSALTLLPDGRVVLCEQVPATPEFVVGNLCEQSLMEIWESKELIDFIVPERNRFGNSPCACCEEFDRCHRYFGRCFRDAFFNFGTPWAPPPNCPKAPPGLRFA